LIFQNGSHGGMEGNQGLFLGKTGRVILLYKQDWDVCHKGIARKFTCNWDEGTFNSKVWG
jgi:hypothetical protein